MKHLKTAFLLALILVVASVGLVSAQAYNTAFITSITYQNVGTATANITFNFYNETSGTAIPVQTTLAAGAGSSLFVGSLSELPSNFSGSAVLSSDQPIVATLVQIPQSDTVKNRPLSNGFSSGAAEVQIATVLKNQFATTTKFSVQNADTAPVDINVKIFAVGSTTPIEINTPNVPVGAAKYYDMGTLSQVASSSFDGSAIVSAVRTGTTTGANIVASAMELSTNGTAARAFEGVTGGATTIYMPSALCNFVNANSAYAVQNTSSTASTNVTVEYSNGNTDTATIAPGNKKSFLGCDVNPGNFNGSAKITSTAADIVVIGKVGGGGRSTAFLGESAGSAQLALPYVRWTSDANFSSGSRQRANIAIQNVGTTAVSGVQVKYLNKVGDVVGIHTLGSIAPSAKANSNATNATLQSGQTQIALDEFGNPEANPGGGFGGAVIVEGPAGSQLVAVVRIASRAPDGSTTGEDYNGIPIQ